MQKNVPKYAPAWVRTSSAWAESSKREISYALCNDRRTLLYGVEALDAPTYAAVVALVLVVVTIAAYSPAARASRTEPGLLMRE